MTNKNVTGTSTWREVPFLIGVFLTLGVLGAFGYFLYYLPVVKASESYSNKWHYLKVAPPNEVGDALAGIAGSLAFVWLVVTVWLQAKELREQRKEFERMAGALDAQAKIFLDEQRQRKEAEAERHANELLASFQACLDSAAMNECRWDSFKGKTAAGIASLSQGRGSHNEKDKLVQTLKLQPRKSEGPNDRRVRSFVEHIRGLSSSVRRARENEKFDRMISPGVPMELDQLLDLSKKICDLKSETSSAYQVMLQRADIETLPELLSDLISSDIWEGKK